jgi:ring-1,2-phenylacetyl-CoA epoxidase subunit PaaD
MIPTRSRAGARVPAEAQGRATVERARAAAASVLDPELPVLTIEDLGVLRDVAVDDVGRVTVTVTPTYSGCPAMEVIERDVESTVRAAGFADVVVRRVLSPAWTTDWMSADGRGKLEAYGIAPPGVAARHRPAGGPVAVPLSVRCPQCGSLDTVETSRFGSTACKSLWQCRACREPFDHMKAI